jgi:hypothetical protein
VFGQEREEARGNVEGRRASADDGQLERCHSCSSRSAHTSLPCFTTTSLLVMVSGAITDHVGVPSPRTILAFGAHQNSR